MRALLSTAVMLCLSVGPVSGDVDLTRVSLGDVPRTNAHYLNAGEAALCRANAATGGVGEYFYNPALISRVGGASGLATVRFNVTSREYLPDDLDSSDDGFLFSQAVAVKNAVPITYGFGYAAPSYRSYELAGLVGGETYEASFTGGLRCFEVLLGTRIGSEGRAGIGIAGGIANLNEEARVTSPGVLETAVIDGIAASFAIGFVLDVTDWLTVGVGHRAGAGVGVEGEWNFDDEPGTRSGRSETQSTSVVGFTCRPTRALAFHGSYVSDGWDAATSTLSAYPDPHRDLFSDSIGTAALGVEFALPGGRFMLRAGGSKVVAGEAEGAVVPEYSAGLGAVVRFQQYSGELSVVREQFEFDGQSAQVINYGIYGSVGYDF
jgi:hypothetical protein